MYAPYVEQCACPISLLQNLCCCLAACRRRAALALGAIRFPLNLGVTLELFDDIYTNDKHDNRPVRMALEAHGLGEPQSEVFA